MIHQTCNGKLCMMHMRKTNWNGNSVMFLKGYGVTGNEALDNTTPKPWRIRWL